MLKLEVRPSTPPQKWQEFIRTTPERSIALDGYVAMGPRFNPVGPRANFNHHEEVSRLETRATCAQVLIAVRMGLFESFVDSNGNPDATLFVNDCDEDIALSVFILRNHHLAIGTMNPLLNRLVFMADMLDTTAGAYPFPSHMDSFLQLMWVFAPYREFRINGGLDGRDPDAFTEVIDSIGDRIQKYLGGTARASELDTRFEVLRRGQGWSLVSEQGMYARIGMFESGVQAFVSVRLRENGNWTYSIGRTSQFIRFPVPKILKRLNEKEGNSDGDIWGGSDIIAGSPRIKGSKLSPELVSSTIESILN